MWAPDAPSEASETFSPCYYTGISDPVDDELEWEPRGNGMVKVKTDYLTVTAPIPNAADLDVPASLIAILHAAVGDAFGKPTVKARGFLGYDHSIWWEHGGAVAAWGGQRDTAMFSLPGEACELVPSWPLLVDALRDAFGGRITRWDGCADDYEGRHTVDFAAQEWLAGRWKGQGRPPKASCAGNWLAPDGKGRTLYVGSRAAGKVARIYEKGKQRGDPASPWVRWEVEIHRVRREIPWAVLTNPRPYIARSYPAMAWVAEPGNVGRIPTFRPDGVIALQSLLHYGSLAYGRLLDTLVSHGIDELTAYSMMRRPGVPKRLAHEELLRIRSAQTPMEHPLAGWFLTLRERELERAQTVRVDNWQQGPDDS